MAGRVDYIDWLKGLSIIIVVWFHSPHPEWVEFPFRMPLFFLASGIFFKIVPWREYLRKKTWQLVIPFVCLYLLTAPLMMGWWKISPIHSDALISWHNFFSPLHPTSGDDTYPPNPPMWFIPALIWLQVILWLSVKLLRNKVIIMILAIGISLAAARWQEDWTFPLMLGKALPFYAYYAFGHLWGRSLLNFLETGKRQRVWTGIACVAVMALTVWPLRGLGHNAVSAHPASLLFILALIVLLMLVSRWLHKVRALRFVYFYGRYSYAVLAMHYLIVVVYLTIFLVWARSIGYLSWEEPTPRWMGYIVVPLVLLTLIPLIRFSRAHLPWAIGLPKKKPEKTDIA